MINAILRQFGFATRYFDSYYKKDFGELIISGNGYLHTNNFYVLESDNDPESLFGFDIDKVLFNMQDITALYRQKHVLDDSLMDCINKSTEQHMEYIFKDEISEHYGREVMHENEADHTDISQGEFPTAMELQRALNTIRRYSVPAISEKKTA